MVTKNKISGVHVFRLPSQSSSKSSSSTCDQNRLGTKLNTRRSHRKSRQGCKLCRQRRRKCDEKQPSCSLCLRKNVHCEYPTTAPNDQPLALAVRSSSIPQRLWPVALSPPVLTANSAEICHTKYDLMLLNHFCTATAHEFQAPEIAQVYQNDVLALGQQFPCLMHAMIALSACHMQHLGIDATAYRQVELFHCNLASRGLRQAVASPINGVAKSDCILTTSMLLNALTFCLADYRDEPPFDVGRREEPRWDWLRIQIGMTALIIATAPFHPESIWMWMFYRTDHFYLTDPPINNLGEQLRAFCGLDELENPEESPYHEVIGFLTPALEHPPAEENCLLYLRAVGAISSEFVDLLESKDVKALLVFAHWLGLMCYIRQWWCTRRVHRECWTIVDYLARTLDQASMHLLQFPAEACGYPDSPKMTRLAAARVEELMEQASDQVRKAYLCHASESPQHVVLGQNNLSA